MSLLKHGSVGAHVRAAQETLAKLGYYLHKIDGDYREKTEDAVRRFQADREFDLVDGKIGDETWKALDDALLELFRHAEREREAALMDVSPPPAAPIPATGDGNSGGLSEHKAQAILARARAEWNMAVQEPPGENWERIDEYIRGQEGLNWDWRGRYTRNREFAWCGAFAAFCYSVAGLNPALRKKVMPSTYRIWTWAKGTARMVSQDQVKPGDIVIVGPRGGKVWGAHITICESVDLAAGVVNTVEGNARGVGPGDIRYEGVIRQTRKLDTAGIPDVTYRAMHVVRPLDCDFD